MFNTDETTDRSPRERLRQRFAAAELHKSSGNTQVFEDSLLLLGMTALNLKDWILRDDKERARS